ncbi:hypothetical protein BC831DRAFT_463288 [Entophlyctis helioformis]|nr:hypothetical protein BC831DRAFT_463288 [Entophlyctis helioformis]
MWTTAIAPGRDAVRRDVGKVTARLASMLQAKARANGLDGQPGNSAATARTGPPVVLLATSDFTADELEDLPRRVWQSALQPSMLVGAVVDSLGSGHGMRLPPGTPAWSLSVLEPSHHPSPEAISLQATGFAVPAAAVHARRNKAVGRWPDLTQWGGAASGSGPPSWVSGARRSDGSDGNAGPAFSSISQSPLRDPWDILPTSLKHRSVPPSLFLMFGDNESHEILQSANSEFPTARLFGLVGARTPFSTGRPFTLFYNDQVMSGGAVGLALSGRGSSQGHHNTGMGNETVGYVDLDLNAYEPLTEPIAISRCRGNIILELDGRNATREILQQIEKSKMEAPSDYRLNVVVQDPAVGRTGVFALSGGDLAKGTLAIDMLADLAPGMTVQLLRFQGKAPAMSGYENGSASGPQLDSQVVQFEVLGTDRNDARPAADYGLAETPSMHVRRGLAAYSELGFIRGDRLTLGGFQVVSVPHVRGTLTF